MKLKNILSYFLLLTGLVGNIRAIDQERDQNTPSLLNRLLECTQETDQNINSLLNEFHRNIQTANHNKISNLSTELFANIQAEHQKRDDRIYSPLIGLLKNTLAADKERGLETEQKIQSWSTEENWISTDLLTEGIGFFEGRENKFAARWDTEQWRETEQYPNYGCVMQKVCEKLKLDQYTVLILTGKMAGITQGLQEIGKLDLRKLKILDIDGYFYESTKEELDSSQSWIKELFMNNHGLTVIFRTTKKISRIFQIK